MKGYTDFAGGMLEGMLRPTAPGGMKYMDWEKAEKICLDNPEATIRAGLMEDWNNTSGIVFMKGAWYDGGILYDASKWATPILDVDGKEIECWTHERHERRNVPTWWGRGKTVKRESDLW